MRKRGVLIVKLSKLILKPNFYYVNNKIRKLANLKITKKRLEEKYVFDKHSYISNTLKKVKNMRNAHGQGHRLVRSILGIFKSFNSSIDELKDLNVDLGLVDLKEGIYQLMPSCRTKKYFYKKTVAYKPDNVYRTSNLYFSVKWLFDSAKKDNNRDVAAGLAWGIMEAVLERGMPIKYKNDHRFEVFASKAYNSNVFNDYINDSAGKSRENLYKNIEEVRKIINLRRFYYINIKGRQKISNSIKNKKKKKSLN